MKKLKFIDLFAGLGGFHLGLQRLGHKCVYACEIDSNLNQIYQKKFKMKVDYDISDVNLKTIPKYDILCAGFPCQPFSKAGTQSGFNHKIAGNMFNHILQFVKAHEPKYLFLENVPNLYHHNKGKTYGFMKRQLEEEDYYDINIDLPPKPNLIFTNYGVSCDKKDMEIKRISANTLSPMAIDDAMERYEDLANFFIETYLISYAIFYYELEQFMYTYEFVPYDSKIIPFRRDYGNFVHPNEPSKQLTFTIFGESDYYKQVEIYLALKEDETNIPKLAKIYQEEDLKAYASKGYEIDLTGL